MSAEPRPWWASDGPLDGGGDPEVDPVAAHRAARRGQHRDGGDGGWHDDDGAEHDPRDEAATHDPQVCGVCPFCLAARALADSRPELREHLAEAARHLLAAARTLLDAPVRGEPSSAEDPSTAGSDDPSPAGGDHPSPAAGTRRVRRIDIDGP